MALNQSINHLQQTSYLLYGTFQLNVCVISKNQYLVSEYL